MGDLNNELDAIFAAYRGSLPDPEPGSGFTPALWARIETRRREAAGFRMLARRLVTAAAVCSLATALLVYVPLSSANPVMNTTYLESLDDDHQVLAELDVPTLESR